MGTYRITTEDGEYDVETDDGPSVDDSHFNKAMDFASPEIQAGNVVSQLTSYNQSQSPPPSILGNRAIGIGDSNFNTPDPVQEQMIAGYHQYSDPIDEARSLQAAKNIGTGALEIGGGVAATALAPELALPRGLGYAYTGITGALGLEGGSQIAQQTGMAPKKTLDETVNSIATNAVVGAGLPIAMEGLGAGSKFVSDMFNKPAYVAKSLGATATDLNPEAQKYIVPKVKELMENSDFFNQKILTSANPGKQYLEAKAYQQQLGQQIGDFYATNQSIPVSRQAILGSAEVQELTNVLGNNYVTPGTKAEAQAALQNLANLPDQEAYNLADVWKLRQDLDSQLVSSMYRKGTGEVTNLADFVKGTADGVRGAMETSIKEAVASGQIAPQAAEALLKAKQEYSNLTPILDILGKKSGQGSATRLIDQIPTGTGSFMKGAGVAGLAAYGHPVLAGIGAGAVALQSNTARALAAQGGNLGEALSALAPAISPYAAVGSALFKRSTNIQDINVDSLSNAVTQAALTMFKPQDAFALSDQVKTVFVKGKEDDKKQLMSALTQQFPQLFEPGPDNYNSVIKSNGKDVFADPFEADQYKKQVVDSDLPPSKRAKIMSGLFNGNKYVPMDTPTEQQPVVETPPMDLGNINGMLGDALSNPSPTDYSYDNSTDAALNQLNDAINRHNQDDLMH